MMFLAPIAGFDDPRFGILTSHKHGVAKGVSSGLPWAADLGVLSGPEYLKRFNPDLSLPWLEKMIPYRETCLFVTVPDVWGDSRKTLESFYDLAPLFPGWPLAFVGQDGLESMEWPDPDRWEVLFVGGSDPWRMDGPALDCIRRAQDLGKRVHIGRVNRRRKYNYWRALEGSERFTCDGTYVRYARDKALEDWADYMESPRQMGLFVSGSDRRSESPDS